jgi:hypothetical protein
MRKMSQESLSELVEVRYKCETCDKNHTLRINKSMVDNSPSYPVSYLHVHGEPQILTTLYIDAKYRVRGVEVLHGVGVEADEFKKIIDQSKQTTLKSISPESILGFQLMMGKKTIKLYFKKNYSGMFNYTEISNILKFSELFVQGSDSSNSCQEVYFKYPKFWIVGLKKYMHTLILVLDSKIKFSSLKSHSASLFFALI